MAISRKRPLSEREVRFLDQTTSVGGASGLECVVSPKGTRSWRLLYRVKGDAAAKRRSLGLGRYPAVSLAEARTRANDAIRLATNGIDPRSARAKRVRDHDVLFGECIAKYLDWCETVNAPGTVEDKRSVVRTHLLPAFGERPVRSIEKGDVASVLDTLAKQPARRRTSYSYLRHFFQWAVERDLIELNPCQVMRPPNLVPSRDRVLADGELCSLWQIDSVFARIGRLSILTAQRRGSIEAMRWDQVDLERRLWSIPASSMKSGRAHDVPLSDLAIAELKQMPRLGGPHVFGVRSDGWSPYAGSSNGMEGLRVRLYGKAWRQSGQGDWRTHDLRRTAVTLAQREGCSIEEIRALTQHRTPGVIGVYARHAYADEKREVVNKIAMRVALVLATQTPQA